MPAPSSCGRSRRCRTKRSRHPGRWPRANQNQHSAPQRLADALAEWIRGQTAGDVMLESQGRPLAPGDVLVLVRRRNAFARALVRALKTRGVPVAGLDRLVLTEQPAVQDLMALADALLLPQDDLTFACLLTSPLGGLDDDEPDGAGGGPRRRAVGGAARRAPRNARTGSAPGTSSPRCWRASTTSRPYALFAEALGPLGGRARLFARLGPEAAEPVDELLQRRPGLCAAASAVAARLPALAAPLRRRGEARGGGRRQPGAHHDGARRQGAAGAAGHPARHHGAAAGRRADRCGRTIRRPGVAVPLFSPRKELRCAAAQRVCATPPAARRMEEHNRCSTSR